MLGIRARGGGCLVVGDLASGEVCAERVGGGWEGCRRVLVRGTRIYIKGRYGCLFTIGKVELCIVHGCLRAP